MRHADRLDRILDRWCASEGIGELAFAKRWREEVVQLFVEAKLRHRWRRNINEAHDGTLVIGVVGAFHGRHHRCVGPLLLPFAGGLSSRVSWRVFVRAVIADDGLHRAYGERGAFLTADGERDGAQNHAILPRIETVSIRAFARRAEARSRPHTRHCRCSRRGVRRFVIATTGSAAPFGYLWCANMESKLA